jgi:hypothetical protein
MPIQQLPQLPQQSHTLLPFPPSTTQQLSLTKQPPFPAVLQQPQSQSQSLSALPFQEPPQQQPVESSSSSVAALSFLSTQPQPNDPTISDTGGEPPIFQFEDIFPNLKDYSDEPHNTLDGSFISFSNPQYKPSTDRKPQE